MEKVYVVSQEPYHDNSTILGAFATLGDAEGSLPDKQWIHDGYYSKNWKNVVAETREETNIGTFMVHELVVGVRCKEASK